MNSRMYTDCVIPGTSIKLGITCPNSFPDEWKKINENDNFNFFLDERDFYTNETSLNSWVRDEQKRFDVAKKTKVQLSYIGEALTAVAADITFRLINHEAHMNDNMTITLNSYNVKVEDIKKEILRNSCSGDYVCFSIKIIYKNKIEILDEINDLQNLLL